MEQLERKDFSFVKGNFAIVAVHLLDGNDDSITKILKDEWYLFNNWYKINDRGDGLEPNRDKEVVRNLYGKNISFSAVAGKNGSGKSSLMSIVYRVLNNLSYLITIGMERNAAEPLFFVEDVHASLFFESGGRLGWVICEGSNITFHWGDEEDVEMSYDWDNDNITDGLLEYNRQFISRHFCFTLVENYALFSLTSDEYSRDSAKRNPIKAKQRKLSKEENDSEKFTNGEWIDSIYNKNDGYQACIGIEPYKGGGNLNLNTQRELALERVVALFIDSDKEPLFDNYCFHHLSLELDDDCSAGVVNKHKDRNLWDRFPASEFQTNFTQKGVTITRLILESYGYSHFNFEDKTVTQLATYIVVKTLSIVQTYDQYIDFRFIGGSSDYARGIKKFFLKYIKEWNEKYPEKDIPYLTIEEAVGDLCKMLRKDKSHITLKLHRALNMMDAIKKFYNESSSWECPSVTDYKNFKEVFYSGVKIENINHLMELLPPSIYRQELFIRKKQFTKSIPLGELSAGEKQFLQTTATILYHIRNIISVGEKYGFAKYYNINLIMDELEVCFHPEYQQKFVKMLLGMLSNPYFQDRANFNVILVTHSPFVLSDTPKCNVLCLEGGRVKNDLHETFCANVFDLLSGHFFLDQFVGYFSSEYTDGVIKQVYRLCDPKKQKKYLSPQTYKKIRAEVNLIGDDIIRMKLIEMLDSHLKDPESYEKLKNKREMLQQELKRLDERLEEYDTHRISR